MQKIKLPTLFVIFVFMTGCVSLPPPYVGPPPNLSSPQSSADELEKFTFAQRASFSDIYSVKMGPANDMYSMASLKPIVAEVSPEGLKKINWAQTIPYYNFALIGIATIVGFSNINSRTNQAYFYGLLGLSVGLSFYTRSVYQDGINDYNRDLQKKLSPTVTWNKNF